jgi:3-deoxy-D-manno-octulosonate 8-phosphate phosphatase (KDO 8-P phosphatase)
MDKLSKDNLSAIKMLVLDLDGVFTDGTILINADGSESKRFSVIDGHGIKLWHRAGLKTAIISGRAAKATSIRAEQLGIEYVYQGCKQKLPVYEKLLEDARLEACETAFIGDDLLDIPLAVRAGFGAAAANAVDELKERVDYVTNKSGGHGAIREVIELILKTTGKWDALMERYLI